MVVKALDCVEATGISDDKFDKLYFRLPIGRVTSVLTPLGVTVFGIAVSNSFNLRWYCAKIFSFFVFLAIAIFNILTVACKALYSTNT